MGMSHSNIFSRKKITFCFELDKLAKNYTKNLRKIYAIYGAYLKQPDATSDDYFFTHSWEILFVTVWRMNLREQFIALNGYKTPEDMKLCLGISIDV